MTDLPVCNDCGKYIHGGDVEQVWSWFDKVSFPLHFLCASLRGLPVKPGSPRAQWLEHRHLIWKQHERNESTK